MNTTTTPSTKNNIEFPSVKDFAYWPDKTKRKAHLHRFENNNLYYNVRVNDNWYTFPISIEDAEGAVFNMKEDATMLKRFYIKALKEQTVQITEIGLI